MKTPHCSIPVISYNGNLIVAAGLKYPAIAARLPANYLTATTTTLGKLITDTIGQKTAQGETGNLTAAQQANFNALLHIMSQVRKTARLAFHGQTVKLHQEFQVGLHAHELAAVLAQADTLLAAIQTAENLPAMKLKGWTDADTAAFTTLRGTFPASSTTQKSGQSDAKKATVAKTADAADAYDRLLTIQNAADLEYPATNLANAPIRAEFRLGIFPPEHHPDVIPDTPANLTAVAGVAGSKRVTANWDHAPHAESYRFRAVAKTDHQEVANKIVYDRQISLVLAQAAAGAVVRLTVTGRNPVGESPASDAVEFTVP